MNRLTGPLRSSSSIHEKVRTSTLIHSGSSTQAKTMPRQVRESRVSAKATGKAMTSAIDRDDDGDHERIQRKRGHRCRRRGGERTRSSGPAGAEKLRPTRRASGTRKASTRDRRSARREQRRGAEPVRRLGAHRRAILQDLARRVVADDAADAAARMRRRAALVEAADRAAVVGVMRRRAREEQLIDLQLAVEDVAVRRTR